VQDHHTYVIAGDGCLMEGVSQEAIGIAGKQQAEPPDRAVGQQRHHHRRQGVLSDVTDQKARFAASGWDVFECDGHDPDDIDRALTAAKASPARRWSPARPISPWPCGAGHLEGPRRADRQGAACGRERGLWLERRPLRNPGRGQGRWESLGARGAKARAEWEARLAALPAAKQAEFRRIFAGEAPAKLAGAIRAVKKAAVSRPPKLATRAASEKVLTAINPVMPKPSAARPT
jgi:transketolase